MATKYEIDEISNNAMWYCPNNLFPWQLKYEIDESAIAHYTKVLRCQIYIYNQVEITHSIKVHLALHTRFQVVF